MNDRKRIKLFNKYEKVWKKSVKNKKEFNKMIEDIAEDTRLTKAVVYCGFRNKFIAHEIFKDYGYETVLDLYLKDYLDSKSCPCDGGDRQCHMDCYMKGKCKYEQATEGGSGEEAL